MVAEVGEATAGEEFAVGRTEHGRLNGVKWLDEGGAFVTFSLCWFVGEAGPSSVPRRAAAVPQSASRQGVSKRRWADLTESNHTAGHLTFSRTGLQD